MSHHLRALYVAVRLEYGAEASVVDVIGERAHVQLGGVDGPFAAGRAEARPRRLARARAAQPAGHFIHPEFAEE